MLCMARQRHQQHRGHFSPPERQLRSALNQLLSQHGLVHGTLIVRRQMYVPRRLEAEVRRWIDNYGKARGLLDDLSRVHWGKVRQRQD